MMVYFMEPEAGLLIPELIQHRLRLFAFHACGNADGIRAPIPGLLFRAGHELQGDPAAPVFRQDGDAVHLDIAVRVVEGQHLDKRETLSSVA